MKLLTVKEVADYFGTHPETVRRWIRTGRLQAVKATARTIRIPSDAIESLTETLKLESSMNIEDEKKVACETVNSPVQDSSLLKIVYDMPADEYHQIKALSKPGLDQLRKSPAHFRAWQDIPPKATRFPSRQFETAVRCALLNKDLFYKTYKIQKHSKSKNAHELKESEGDFENHLTQDQWNDIQGIIKSILKNPSALLLLNSIKPHVAFFNVWDGINVKARVDGFKPNCLLEIKTVADASKQSFAKTCAQLRYHVQASFYQRLTGISELTFIAIEREAPYGVACYQLDDSAIKLGNSAINHQLKNLRECQNSNSWPCYSEDIEKITLPDWANRQDI